MKQENLAWLSCGLVAGLALMWAMQSGGGRWQVIQADRDGPRQNIIMDHYLLDTATGKSYVRSGDGSAIWLLMSLRKE